MLTLEAVFTAVLARLWYHETLDRRVILALALLTLGGAALVLDRADAGSSQVLGLIVVMVATAAWGVDNTVSRALAERDPGQVVMIKGALGATATALLAVAFGERCRNSGPPSACWPWERRDMASACGSISWRSARSGSPERVRSLRSPRLSEQRWRSCWASAAAASGCWSGPR